MLVVGLGYHEHLMVAEIGHDNVLKCPDYWSKVLGVILLPLGCRDQA